MINGIFFSYLLNNAQGWKYAISTGYFHLIRICQCDQIW